jgi:ferritin-like metal-binding protein YciE
VKALPKVAKAANNEELKAGIEAHLEETVEHVNRLEGLLEGLGETTRGPRCKGMEGLLAESADLLEEEADQDVLDAGIIAGAQRIEHYEIAGYGCARTYAELLGEEDAAAILQNTLDEEIATDQKLTDLAMSVINIAAADHDSSGTKNGGRRNGGTGKYVKGPAGAAESDDEDDADDKTPSRKSKSAPAPSARKAAVK